MSLRLLLDDHPAWREEAACRGDARFVDTRTPTSELRPVCMSCPVRRVCLAFALTGEERHDTWGGFSFAERAAYCPVCGERKAPEALGCDDAHSLIRVARLIELEREGDPDVSFAQRQVPSARQSEDCPLPLGRDHATARAYDRRGCRCPAARRALNAERAKARRAA